MSKTNIEPDITIVDIKQPVENMVPIIKPLRPLRPLRPLTPLTPLKPLLGTFDLKSKPYPSSTPTETQLSNNKDIEKASGTYLEPGTGINWVLPDVPDKYIKFMHDKFSADSKYWTNDAKFKSAIQRGAKVVAGKLPEPFPYQKFILDYMRFGTPNRGLLLEHGLGSGKSRSFIMVAETFRRVNRKILILTPAFLRLNMIDEIKKWADDDIRTVSHFVQDKMIKDSYMFVHYNAGGITNGKGSVFEQLARLGIGFPDGHPKQLPYIKDNYNDLKPPHGLLIGIEEFHNLSRSFTKDGGIRRLLYDLLMMATDCKLIALTGTPIVAHPREMLYGYNVIRGQTENGPLFGTDNLADFDDRFIDRENRDLRNKSILSSTILGMTSVFPGIRNDEERTIYPAKDETVIKVPMSEYQQERHDEQYIIESGGGRGNLNLDKERSVYTRSRQLSNFVFPPEIKRPKVGDTVGWQTLGTDYTIEFEFEVKSLSGDRFSMLSQLKNPRSDHLNPVIAILNIHGKRNIEFYPIRDNKTSYETAANILTANIQELFTPKEALKYLSVYLSTKSKNNIKCVSTKKDQEAAALHKLVEGAEKYLTIDALKTKYSPKMAKIYETILEGPGALKLCNKDYTEPHWKEDTAEETIRGDNVGEDDEESFLFVDVKNVLTNDKVVSKDDPEYQESNKVEGGPAMVYSYFNNMEGVGIFSLVLAVHGFKEYHPVVGEPKDLPFAPRYAFIKGGMTDGDKKNVLTVFNSPRNKHGQLIRVIFVTQAAAEGISLHYLRQIHIMERYWESNLINQVAARGLRLHSHSLLPVNQRIVHIFHYHAIHNKNYASRADRTIDDHVLEIAKEKDILLEKLAALRASAAVDCTINGLETLLSNVKCFTAQEAKHRGRTAAKESDKTTHTRTVGTATIIKHDNKLYAYDPNSSQVNIVVGTNNKIYKVWKGYGLEEDWKVGSTIDLTEYSASVYIYSRDGKKSVIPMSGIPVGDKVIPVKVQSV
jgi:hypothetical protein